MELRFLIPRKPVSPPRSIPSRLELLFREPLRCPRPSSLSQRQLLVRTKFQNGVQRSCKGLWCRSVITCTDRDLKNDQCSETRCKFIRARTCWFSVKRDDDVIQRSTRRMCHRNDPCRLEILRRSDTEESRPLTINSTILIPKCSSTIVLRPMLALDSQPSTSEYDAFITNWTWLYTT
jgi:hypothetical protein